MAMPSNEVMGKGEKIAVIGGDQEQGGILVKLLEALGYVAHGIFFGEGAMEYLRCQCVDLLLLDMDLGHGMDGLETYLRARLLRADQKQL